MRQFIFFLASLFSSLFIYGQNDSTQYYFSQVGLTVFVPKQFKLQDPKPKPEYLDAGLKPITDSAVIKQMTKDDPKMLLEIVSLDGKSVMSIKLIPITTTLTSLMGDSTQYIENSKKWIIAEARQASEKFDTLFTKVKINNHLFDKMFTISNLNGQDYYKGAYVTKISGNYLSVSMFFEKGYIGNQLMNVIEGAKFDQ